MVTFGVFEASRSPKRRSTSCTRHRSNSKDISKGTESLLKNTKCDHILSPKYTQ